ncbi:unnamed protein product [Ceratitis capitata]|uniref:(Mediterranean fruit fly) hypothetical protein n=1 Tax=Ceratitis capitata TaxID=7213 RepID=A0A811UVV0_CERCA|nr:unnamed protein product [Ceratitis capitata]
MLSLGRRANLDKASINFYTINSLNDLAMARTLLTMNLNKLLRNAWVSVTGNKAHKVATLIEAFGCDQVEASDLEQEEPWEKPISDLREMIADLARSTAAIASTQSTAATISTPQRMEAPHQDIHQTPMYQVQDVIVALPV